MDQGAAWVCKVGGIVSRAVFWHSSYYFLFPPLIFHTIKIPPQALDSKWTNKHALFSIKIMGGMPEWQIKYKTSPHLVFPLHRCVQGLSCCHTRHLTWSLRILSLSFQFLGLSEISFPWPLCWKTSKRINCVKLQMLWLPLVHNNLSIIVACKHSTLLAPEQMKSSTFFKETLNTTPF